MKIHVIVNLTVFAAAFSINMNAKSAMPALDRLKSKVENALNGPKTSFREFLEKTQNTVNSKILINGRPVASLRAEEERKAFEKEITQIEADLANLYWCKQDKFAEQLKQSKNILSSLKGKFKERYPKAKAPLMTFAKDLDKENSILTAVGKKIVAAKEPIKKFAELEQKYKALATSIVKYIATLNDIIKATDSL